MSAFTSIFRFAAGVGFTVVSRIVFIVLFGLILNIVLLILLPDMCDLSKGELGVFNYIGQAASNCTLAFLIGLLFFPIFPIAYFLLAQKYGIQKGIHYSYVQNKKRFYDYFTQRVSDTAKAEGELQTSDNANSLNWVKGAARFLDKLDNTPFVMRIVLNFLKDRIPFVPVIEKISNELDLSGLPPSEAATKIATEADEYIEDDLLKPDSSFLLGLTIVNLLVFGGLYWFFN